MTGSEYLLGLKYFRVLSIPGLSICQGSEFSGLHRIPVSVNMTIINMSRDPVTERSEYFRIPNIPGFCICKHYTMFQMGLNMDIKFMNTCFFTQKTFIRKSPVSNTWAAGFENAGFSWSSF